MDKKTLVALNNFAAALEELVDSMLNKAKEEEDFGGLGGIFSGQQDINSTLVRISDKIDNIESSNKAMIENQEKILNMTKDIKADNESKNMFSFSNNKKSKKFIKDGVSSILLIAGGVLAIGLAFKIIGEVDFVSVIALSIALPLIAAAFTLVAVSIKEYELNIGDIIMTSISMLSMALAIVGASWILAKILPIGEKEFISALKISAIIAIASYSVSNVMSSLKNASIKELIMLPIVFVSMALAITLSSFILNKAQPVGNSLLLNLIVQSLALSVVAIALSIPIKILKLFGLGVTDIIKGGIMLVVVAATMMISSLLINLGTYDKYPSLDWAIGAGAALTILSIPIIIMGLISMTGVGLGAIALGGVATIMVSATVMVASHILNEGEYGNFPAIEWSLGVGSSILGFGIAMTALGFMMLSGVGAIALGLGSVAVMIVAESIVAVAEVLSKGNFGNAGALAEWALGVTLLYITFVPIFLLLGAVSMASGFLSLITFGTSPDPFESAKNAMVKIAETIRDVSFVLSDGNYTGGPTPKWALGVGLAIGAFAPVFATLQNANVLSIFGGSAFSYDDYANTIITISRSVLTAATIFKGAPDNWGGHPTIEWAEGVGAAIGAFAPVFKILQGNGILDAIFGTSIKPEDMSNAIKMISTSIMDAADLFANDKGSYKGGPTKDWSEGVGGAISSFSSVYKLVDDGLSLVEAMESNLIISMMAKSMIGVNNILNKSDNWFGYPDDDWTKGVSSAITSFSKIYDWITDGINYDSDDIESGNEVILGIVKNMKSINVKLGDTEFGSYPNKDWGAGVSSAIMSFSKIYDWITSGVNYDVEDITVGNTIIYKIVASIINNAKIFNGLSKYKINANLVSDIAKNINKYAELINGVSNIDTDNLTKTSENIKQLAIGVGMLAKALTNLNVSLANLQTNQLDALTNISGTLISFSVIDADNFEEIMEIVEDKSKSLAKLFGTAKENLDKSGENSKFSLTDQSSLGSGEKSGNGEKSENYKNKEKKKTLDDVYNMLNAMNSQLAQISSHSNNLSKYVNELRANPDVKVK